LSRFLDEGVIPAARAAGANIRVPTPEDAFFSNLPVDIRDRLQTFSDAARKPLPLNREEAESWREFVIAAFRAKAVIDAQSFIDWLAAAGWPRETAAELNLRFFDHYLLLSRYADGKSGVSSSFWGNPVSVHPSCPKRCGNLGCGNPVSVVIRCQW
jgi:hypothetical protein